MHVSVCAHVCVLNCQEINLKIKTLAFSSFFYHSSDFFIFLFIHLFTFRHRILGRPGWSSSHCVAKDDLEP